MNEKALTVLEQYDIQVKSTYRLKGNYGCETEKGRYILEEYHHSNEKLVTMSAFYMLLEKQGFTVDRVIENKEGEYVSISEDGYSYILKKWFVAEECSNNNKEQLYLAAKNLARLHNVTENTKEILGAGTKLHNGRNMLETLDKHTAEILRIKNYIKKRKNKNYFEMSLHNIIEEYYNQAVEAKEMLARSYYFDIYHAALEHGTMNHGAYNYHNILFSGEKVIMINLLKINYAPAIQDLYDFLRKIMEKNSWDIHLGNQLLDTYNHIRPISAKEFEVLKCILKYPEKFWKIINYYYNSNKAWYSEKNEDKLKQFMKQENLRWNFINNI